MQQIIRQLAAEIRVGEQQVRAAVELLDGGATVPFIARYRKEATGGLDDVQLRELDARLAAVKEELAAAEDERAESAKKVNPQFILYYERLRTKRWPVVVSLQPDCVCNGCHLVQPPSVGQMVWRNQGLVPCQMCGRILYKA